MSIGIERHSKLCGTERGKEPGMIWKKWSLNVDRVIVAVPGFMRKSGAGVSIGRTFEVAFSLAI